MHAIVRKRVNLIQYTQYTYKPSAFKSANFVGAEKDKSKKEKQVKQHNIQVVG